MRLKTWFRRFGCFWTRKGRSTRALIREFGPDLGLGARQVHELVLSIEKGSVDLARHMLLQMRAEKEKRERERPPNQSVTGSRLASPPTYR